MDAFLLSHEEPVRLGAFFGIFAAMAGQNVAMPRCARHELKQVRSEHILVLGIAHEPNG